MNDWTYRLAGRSLYISFILVICCASHLSFSQTISVKASVNRDKILIGEPIEMQLEAILPMGADAATWFPIDSIPHFEFIDQGRIDTVQSIEGKAYKQTVTITSFDSGRWFIPSLALDVNGKSYLTDSLPVTVAFSDFNPEQDYHDIKDILSVENVGVKYVNWGLAALTILSLLAVIYFLRKRGPSLTHTVHIHESRYSPLEEALQSLEELKKQQLPAQGQVKLYYTRLNDILRSFMSRQMAISTMQKTNEELTLQLQTTGLPKDTFILLVQTLKMSDAVKFAKFVPDDGYNEQSFQNIKQSVEVLNDLQK